MTNKRVLIIAVSTLVLVSATAFQALAQSSCPNTETYGVQQPSGRESGETRRVRVTLTYFRTNDRGAFIPESEDLSRSSSFIKIQNADFLNRLRQLEQQSEASISSRLVGNMFLGDRTEYNLERNATNAFHDFGDLSSSTLVPNRWFNLDRQTTVNVEFRGDESFYRILLLSSFVDVRPETAEVTVDLDAGTFLQPNETVIYKLFSDFEVARSAAGRAHLAVSVQPVE